MKYYLLKASFFLIPVFILTSFIPSDNSSVKDTTLVKVIIENLNAGHYKPLPIDDEFSKKAYSLYLKRLDANKRFLLKEDIDKLKKYETLIDDEIQDGTFQFFDLSVELLNKRIKESEGIYKEILASPFDFKKMNRLKPTRRKRILPKTRMHSRKNGEKC